MKKKAVWYLARLTIQKLLGLGLFYLGAGFLLPWRAAVYFGLVLAGALFTGLFLLRRCPETLARRGDVKTNAPLWDKLLLGLFWLGNYFVLYLLAGLETAEPFLPLLYWAGLALCFWSGWISFRALRENTFLESTARLQTDREQQVCRTGPYATVRHPAYTGLLISLAGCCLVFQTPMVMGCCVLLGVLVIVRTVLEDRMLRRGLAGYADYAAAVRWRLIPFIW